MQNSFLYYYMNDYRYFSRVLSAFGKNGLQIVVASLCGGDIQFLADRVHIQNVRAKGYAVQIRTLAKEQAALQTGMDGDDFGSSPYISL